MIYEQVSSFSPAVSQGAMVFHAAAKPERVNFFNAGGRMRIVHNGFTV
jgi:hypothetical protein